MRMIANRPEGRLIVSAVASFKISNRVRSLREGTRRSDEVVYTIPHGLPYDPAPFPAGVWRVTGVEWQKDASFDYATYGPVKIRTDAFQWVKVWELDEDGDYLRERGDAVQDRGYLLHYSVSSTTLGCLRLSSSEDAETLGRLLEKVLWSGERVELEVM